MEQWADVLETDHISGLLLNAAQALIIAFVRPHVRPHTQRSHVGCTN